MDRIKKCIPQKFSGRFKDLASNEIGIVEVLEARIALSANNASVSASTAAFTFDFQQRLQPQYLHR